MSMIRFINIAVLIIAPALGISAQWMRADVGSTESFRGLAVVNEKIIWASGTNGAVIKTADGGRSWKVIRVPGAEKLDFRDIEAFDSNNAYILSIGNGESSRIYKTTDGGITWSEQFRNKDERAFFDAIACWDRNNCIAMSDPVEGHYPLISTNDGRNWSRIVSNNMPAAKDGEAAFAASGTCLITQGKGNAFLVSGGTDARVFRSVDRGRTWAVADIPIVKGKPGAGIFSIAMYDDLNGVVTGGDYEQFNNTSNTLAFTSNGGKTWSSAAGLNGYRSAVAYVFSGTLVAVGTNGSDLSLNGGRDWKALDRSNFNSVQAKGRNAVWAVGPKGFVAKMETLKEAVKRSRGNRPSGR